MDRCLAQQKNLTKIKSDHRETWETWTHSYYKCWETGNMDSLILINTTNARRQGKYGLCHIN